MLTKIIIIINEYIKTEEDISSYLTQITRTIYKIYSKPRISLWKYTLNPKPI